MSDKNHTVTKPGTELPMRSPGQEFAPYAPPAIEEDLPLEVMSLACAPSFGTKGSAAGGCQIIGS